MILKINDIIQGLDSPNSQAFLLEVDEDYLVIRVISDIFVGVNFIRRVRILIELFENRAPELSKKYTLIFEPLTKSESTEPKYNS
jgi:hypothetical protein